MVNSLLIDNEFNDLMVDALGNIAVCSEPQRLAQDAACAVRLFQGELYYDTTAGIPFWPVILGHWPPLTLVKAYIQQAAMTATGVTSATCYITDFTDRKISGQVQCNDAQGNIVSVARF